MSERWVNAEITVLIALDVPVDASIGEKADAAAAAWEAREWPEGAVCGDKHCASKGTYERSVKCGNCDWAGTLIITQGHKFSSWIACPHCGCRRTLESESRVRWQLRAEKAEAERDRLADALGPFVAAFEAVRCEYIPNGPALEAWNRARSVLAENRRDG